MKGFKSKFLMFFALTSAISVAIVFSLTYISYNKLENIKPKVEAQFTEWAKQNECQNESNPVCTEYEGTVKNYLQQIEKIKRDKELKPLYKALFFLRDSDKEYFSEISQKIINNDTVKNLDEKYFSQVVTNFLTNSNGRVSIAVSLIMYLLLMFLIARLLSAKGSKENSTGYVTRSNPKVAKDIYSLIFQNPPPDRYDLLDAIHSADFKKSSDWLDLGKKIERFKMPELEIQCLEKGLMGSLSPKLAEVATLLCATLQLKHNINAERGRDRLMELKGSSRPSISKRASDALFLLNK